MDSTVEFEVQVYVEDLECDIVMIECNHQTVKYLINEYNIPILDIIQMFFALGIDLEINVIKNKEN